MKRVISALGWTGATLFALILANMCLFVFMAALDIAFGYPPQLIAPLLVPFIIALCGLLKVCRIKHRYSATENQEDELIGPREKNRQDATVGRKQSSFRSAIVVRSKSERSRAESNRRYYSDVSL
jgi:hypothetical protein